MTTGAAAALVGGLVSAIAVPALAGEGLRQLRRGDARTLSAAVVAVVLGASAGATVTFVLERHGGLPFAPAFLLWSSALVAASVCDALTQRIPTPLVRQAAVATAALLIGGAMISDEWQLLALGALGSLIAGLSLLAAERLAGVGPGDVRLAALGGLGLGYASPTSVAAGLCAWAGILTVQATMGCARGGSLKTRVALGPGMAAGFLVAVVLTA